METPSFTCREIAEAIGAELSGDADALITSIESINNAAEGSISFITGKKFVAALRASKATAVILQPAFVAETTATKLIMDNPYLGYAKLTQLWSEKYYASASASVHESACVSDTAKIDPQATVGPHAVIESGAVIGANAVVGAGVFIAENVTVGANTIVHPNSTLLRDSKIGTDCEIHSGAVIGADGFGFAPNGQGWHKIHQLGAVKIGNSVSIGACTTVDRGALEDTVIEDGVILDNHIQVAHNVTIGRNTAIAGCTGIAGSTNIGANCRIGGAVSIVGHISICDNVVITANSFVNRSVTEAGSYSSGFPLETSAQWRKNAVRLQRLDEISRQVGKLKS